MEFVFYPAKFGVSPSKAPTPDGGELDTMVILLQDAGGASVKIVFGDQDWLRFADTVADPAEAAKRAAARRQILGPGGLAPVLRERKH